MAQSLGNTIADSLQLSLGYASRLLDGITAENFARFASPGGQLVVSNHPAFIYGHLALYAPTILQQLGRADLVVDLPGRLEAACSRDAQCVDDSDGSIYPAMDEVLQVFTSGYEQTVTALRAASEETLQQPNPSGMAERFPTLGSLHAFYVGGHMMLHLGQLSAWRRMQGFGPA